MHASTPLYFPHLKDFTQTKVHNSNRMETVVMACWYAGQEFQLIIVIVSEKKKK